MQNENVIIDQRFLTGGTREDMIGYAKKNGLWRNEKHFFFI